MKRLLLALVLSLVTANAFANHLPHNVPAEVGADLEKACTQLWPSSSFSEGWCVDQRASEWIRMHPDASKEPPPEASQAPGVITEPGLLDVPNKDQK